VMVMDPWDFVVMLVFLKIRSRHQHKRGR
jgi:hypothetical protein